MSSLVKPSATNAAIAEHQVRCKQYAAARSVVAERVATYHEEVAAVQRRLLPGIRTAVAHANDLRSLVVAHVTEHKELFQQPKSMTLHGIKSGLQKGSGKIDWEVEDDVLIARIEKKFKDDEARLAVLINIVKKPSRDGLRTLDTKDLAALGVTVEATGDFAYAKGTDSEVDKLVKKILGESEREAVNQEAA